LGWAPGAVEEGCVFATVVDGSREVLTVPALQALNTNVRAVNPAVLGIARTS